MLPMLVYILLMQLRPVQDIAYASMASRTAFGGPALAQGLVGVALALGAIAGNLSSGLVADSVGWTWVPVAMMVSAGLAFVMGMMGRNVRDQLVAEAAIDRDMASTLAATVPDVHLPPSELFKGGS